MKKFSDVNPQDAKFMRIAIDLAANGRYTARPNPCVGCVIVKDNQIISEGWHWQAGLEHAEVSALANLPSISDAEGATMYVSLEPCSHQGRQGPCVEQILAAKLARVVIATEDPNPMVAGQGIQILQAAGIDVVVGILKPQAQALNLGFFSRFIRQRPYVRLKMAMSLDGKIAMANGQSQWITSSKARQQVMQIRAQSAAVLTGSGTVNQDNCTLTARDVEQLNSLPSKVQFVQPIRLVVDSNLSISPQANILSGNAKTIIFYSEKVANTALQIWQASAKQNISTPSNLSCVQLPLSTTSNSNNIDLMALLNYLSELEINDLLVEAGAKLAGALLQNNLVDELLLFMAPKILGHNAKSAFYLPGITELADHIGGKIIEQSQVGVDNFLRIKCSNFMEGSNDFPN